MLSSSPIRLSRGEHSGFALVSSLCLLTLLFLLALGLVQLSTVEKRQSHITAAHLTARANARLALHIALAELQRYAGNDQVVTSRADLIDSRVHPNATADPSIKHPFYTLAFQTEPIQSTNTNEGVRLRKVKKFPACLVSGNECYDLLSWEGEEYPKGYTTEKSDLSNKRSVSLAASHSTDKVSVPLVQLPNHGSYAYWVSDEGCKARINTEDIDRPHNAHLNQLSPHQAKHFNSLRAPSQLTPTELELLPDNEKNLSINTVTIHGDEHKQLLKKFPHSYTASSRSVLCDLQNGGLKKNLTAAINLGDQDFLNLTKHTEDEAKHPSPVFLYQKWTFPPEVETLSFSHYAGAPWELIRSYIRRPEWENELTGPTPTLLSHLGAEAHELPHYWQSSETSYRKQMDARLVRRQAILTRFQIAYDFSLEYHGISEESGELWHSYSIRQHFLPLAIFWNPYNVDLAVSEPVEMQLYLDRNWSSGRHNTKLTLTTDSSDEWQILSLLDDTKNEVPHWSPTRKGTAHFIYPFHPAGNTAVNSELCRLSFHIPTHTLPAGKTVVFSAPHGNSLLRYSRNTPNMLKKGYSIGHSFYSKNAKLRIKAENEQSPPPSTPSLSIVRYPTDKGDERTRLQVTNNSSFQRINWDFATIVSSSNIAFIPQEIEDASPLLSGTVNGSQSPQFTASLIRKFPDISHHLSNSQQWLSPSNKLDTNSFNTSWQTFFNSNGSRYGAYGSHPNHVDIFTAPPQYISGISIGASPLIQPELNSNNEAYVGHSDSFSSGSNKAIQFALPRSETRSISLAHLSQLNTSKWVSNYNADQSNASATDCFTPSNVIGNSFLPPHIPPSYTKCTILDRHAFSSDTSSTHYDQSYSYNQVLWDRYFLTGDRSQEVLDTSKTRNFCPNRNLEATEPLDLTKWKDPHKSANMLLLRGGFNVNSTSVKAWEALLSATRGLLVSHNSGTADKLTPFPQLQYTSASPTTAPPQDTTEKSLYDGTKYRALTDSEITELAEAIVAENKRRGPAATLSQWINRSLHPQHHYRKFASNLPLSPEDVCYEGVLQAAINRTSINGAFNEANSTYPTEISAAPNSPQDFEYGKINPLALKYHSGFGNPATLTQSAILQRIGHLLTARSDTFKIRAYGDHKNAQGKILAKAYCEAIVQRFQEYHDSSNTPDTSPYKWQLSAEEPLRGTWSRNTQLSELNHRYGRRYKVIQFRWLNPKEI